MFDIDHFKKINDSYGHLVGDQILRDLAERCKGILRQYDIIARYGGEEFVVILPETFVEEAEVLAERLRKTVEETTFDMQAEGITVTISLGVSRLEFDQLITSEDLIASADQALYESKENGRNCVTIGHFTNNNQLRLFKG